MNIIIYSSSNERYCPLCKSNELQDDPIRMEVFCRSCGCVCMDTSLPTIEQKMAIAGILNDEFSEKKFIEKSSNRNQT